MRGGGNTKFENFPGVIKVSSLMRNSRDAPRRGTAPRKDGRKGAGERWRGREGKGGREEVGRQAGGYSKRSITKRALLLYTTSCKHGRSGSARSLPPSRTHILAVRPGQGSAHSFPGSG